MPKFSWIEFLILARELGERNNKESALRSSISRAYYAAYNAAKAYCVEKNIQVFKVKGSHEDLWDALQREDNILLRMASVKGDRLRRKRALADYEEEVDGLVPTVERCLDESHEILKTLGLPSPPP